MATAQTYMAATKKDAASLITKLWLSSKFYYSFADTGYGILEAS